MAGVPATLADRPVRLTVTRTGWHGVRISDHPNPEAHSGHTIEVGAARAMAAALRADQTVRIPTLSGRVLALQGLRLGDVAVWDRAWLIQFEDRPALAAALDQAAGGS